MPSCHRDMEVRYALAKRNKSLGQVIIKVRRKPGSFRTKQEEQTWRASTELCLNLPASSSVCQIYEVLDTPKAYYVVMEKVGGMDLCETVHSAGRLPLQEVKEIIHQLLQGVAEMHANGCIHKDIKLENVMLERATSTSPTSCSSSPSNKFNATRSQVSCQSSACSPCSVKLIDFDTLIDWSPKTPKAKEIVGTNQYIAPEAYKGHYSPSSDMFSVGVIMYHLLTGAFPFDDRIFDDERGGHQVGHPTMQDISSRMMMAEIRWDQRVFTSDPAAKRLLEKLLATSAAARPSASAALKHPWFTQVRNRPSTTAADGNRNHSLSLAAQAVLRKSGKQSFV